MHLILNPVGDGLFMEVFSRNRRLITDYGSTQALPVKTLFRFDPSRHPPTDFLLSHFHRDHYRGLFLLEKHGIPARFSHVYSPQLPKLPEARKVFFAMRAIDAFSFGGWSGSIDNDFIRTIRRINGGGFSWHRLSQGDQFSVGERQFTVSWPPSILPEETRESIVAVIRDFEEEIKRFPQVREFYEQVQERGEMWVSGLQDINHDGDEKTIPVHMLRESLQRDMPVLDENTEIAEVLAPINRKLKNAANFFSLAYFDYQLNFFGDLYPTEIKACVEFIQSTTLQRQWRHIVLPHHGTQWDDSLLQIHGLFGCTSIGPGLLQHWKMENDQLCYLNLKTYAPSKQIVLNDDAKWSIYNLI